MVSFNPVKLGDHVFVSDGAVVEAALVGINVHIGALLLHFADRSTRLSSMH